MDSVIQTINAPNTGILSIDSQSITNTSQGLTSQIDDLQAALATQEANLTTIYSNVNTTLQELPMLESQISQQLSGINSAG